MRSGLGGPEVDRHGLLERYHAILASMRSGLGGPEVASRTVKHCHEIRTA